MHRALPAAVLLLLSPAPPWSRAEPPLQVAVEDAADPWSRPDGTGFANELVASAFRAAGIDVQLIVVPYARCKHMVVEGTVAACFSMSVDPDLHGTVAFPATPLFVCTTALLQNPARPLRATRLRDLPRGTVVGTVLSYEYPPEVEQAREAGTIVLDEAPSEAILLRKLAAGRLDAALVNVNEIRSLDYLSALAGITSGVERVGRVGMLASYVGFSVRNPRGAWARDAFDVGMHRIAATGTLGRIVRQWSDTSRAVVRALRAGPRSRTP